jgi:hypothetical protein
MLESLINRKPKAAPPLPAEPGASTPEAALARFRDQVAAARLEINRLSVEHRRRLDDAEAHRVAQTAAAASRAALERLHGRGAPAEEIAAAETALDLAESVARRAAPAEAGCRAAADRIGAEINQRQVDIAVVRTSARPFAKALLHQRVAASVKRERVARAEYVAAYTAHHAEAAAIEAVLTELGFPYGTENFMANRGAGLLEISTTITREHPGAIDALDLVTEITTGTRQVIAELRTLLP